MDKTELINQLRQIIPKNGIVFNEKEEFSEILCKPKLLPLKSMTLKKLEDLEKNFNDTNNQNQQKINK